MVKDMQGKDISVGDKLIIHPDCIPKLMFAIVAAVSEGGLAVATPVPGQKAITGGQLKCNIELIINFNPVQPIAVILLEKGAAASVVVN